MSNRSVIRHRRRGVKGMHPLFLSFKGRGKAAIPINLCLRPGSDAGSVQDFRDLHRDTMRERKVKRVTTRINVRGPWYWKKRKNTIDNQKAGYPAFTTYLKSIWPKDKFAIPGRMD